MSIHLNKHIFGLLHIIIFIRLKVPFYREGSKYHRLIQAIGQESNIDHSHLTEPNRMTILFRLCLCWGPEYKQQKHITPRLTSVIGDRTRSRQRKNQ